MILKALPQTQNDVKCTRDVIAQLSKLYKAGEEVTCKQDKQKWTCSVFTTGYSCIVTEMWQPEPTKTEPTKPELTKPEPTKSEVRFGT